MSDAQCYAHAVVEGRWWSANFTDGTLLSTVGGGVLQVLLQIDLASAMPVYILVCRSLCRHHVAI